MSGMLSLPSRNLYHIAIIEDSLQNSRTPELAPFDTPRLTCIGSVHSPGTCPSKEERYQNYGTSI
jgi:hypothetical protein